MSGELGICGVTHAEHGAGLELTYRMQEWMEFEVEEVLRLQSKF